MIAVAAFTLALSIQASTAPATGQAKGNLGINGRRLALKYAIAVSGPDTFEPTQEAIMIFLTADPIPQSTIDGAATFSDVRHAVDAGMIYRFRAGDGFHITFRHAALGDRELQTSGPASALEKFAVTPDSVSGSIVPWMGTEEDIMEYKVAYSIDFTAPIVRRFPLDKPVVFTAKAAKLPAGGGAPGKAFLSESCKPVPTDAKSVEAALKEAGAMPTDKDLQEMSKTEGHPVTRADFVAQMVEMAKATAPLRTSDCKVLGGRMEGDAAVLQVEANTMGSRGRADVIMVKEGANWKVKREGTWTPLK